MKISEISMMLLRLAKDCVQERLINVTDVMFTNNQLNTHNNNNNSRKSNNNNPYKKTIIESLNENSQLIKVPSNIQEPTEMKPENKDKNNNLEKENKN
ncbi:hypothetical protein BCR32DRAFT_286938 [Anaeromyces robustus]|uniref:Uncharacterized protein n=1 Tax=Anaeromyces robustus TaxID=1754192 RepID=A0A1Y1VUI6_9FUNG|nr:hypothetical protein BCR32DRAFT_286938 [Anaeromyces robustus]|eukprot:ORX64675.1 hypothetical protein BCR32DRAFT_286938 [Anaeromyces robustus]